MALTIPAIDTAVTDLALSRRRIWKRTRVTNRAGQPVIKDTGIDLVQYDGFPEGIEPGVSTFELRADGKVSDKRYTGILVLDENDAMLQSVGGYVGRGAFL